MAFEPVEHKRLLEISDSVDMSRRGRELVDMARELILARTRIAMLEMDVEALQTKVKRGY